ncbi:unnamed protein product [Ilex paraguariensis]|uniref:UDP-glycosyltransferase 87A1 n=1 Tax=Ilex paraguariensis TaxID=185542 RepID=A0ABC8T7R2_9AQUA
MDPTINYHVVAIPYPGRGHINPMMNLCKLMASRRADILITFIVTEEWLGFLGSETKPANLRFGTIPNVIPSELVRDADFPGFLEATLTKLEAPVERLLDRLEPPKPSVVIYDTVLAWVVRLGYRRNIPVAALWTMSAMVFSTSCHHDLIRNGHVKANVSERGKDQVDNFPGVPSIPTADLGEGQKVAHLLLEGIVLVPKAQYLLLASIYELEYQVIDTLKAELPIAIYSIGPAIPCFTYIDNSIPITGHNVPDYMKWLNAQPRCSVLYIAQGSFISLSSSQLDEIVAGVQDSGVRYLWVARGETSLFEKGGGGFVVPWCDQLKVLCHSSIGGFWSHCGWNSTKEGAFAGLPMLAYPIVFDQISNSKMIVENWKMGWSVKREGGGVDTLIRREEIAGLVQRFMDLESEEGKEMRGRAKEIQEICRRAVGKGGSAETNIDAFMKDML